MDLIIDKLQIRYNEIIKRLEKREWWAIKYLPQFTHRLFISKLGFSKDWQEYRTILFITYLAYVSTNDYKYIWNSTGNNYKLNKRATDYVKSNYNYDNFICMNIGDGCESLKTVEELEKLLLLI